MSRYVKYYNLKILIIFLKIKMSIKIHDRIGTLQLEYLLYLKFDNGIIIDTTIKAITIQK